ncbi:unnamed protein product [Lactuca saligna]|uniref:Uncharacterized protein n=1 Tax=Lactuca saligna TaxID=75948 RepID=A0AA36DXT8_LACSI|nr:unnamed protein product [Lactuca saligna]
MRRIAKRGDASRLYLGTCAYACSASRQLPLHSPSPSSASHHPSPPIPIAAITIEASQQSRASPSSIVLVFAYCFPFFSFPFRSIRRQGRASVAPVVVATPKGCRVCVGYHQSSWGAFPCMPVAVGQKSMGTTMAAAMAAITLLPSPYATKRVVGFPLRVKE